MPLLLLSQINLSFGERDILKEVHLEVDAGSRTALAGVNGSGKTTLLRIAAGLLEPDSGVVRRSPDCTVGYLPQTGLSHTGRSLWSETERAYDDVMQMITRRDIISERLTHATAEQTNLEEQIDELGRLQERIDSSGYYEREGAMASVLRGLGFSDDDFGKDTSRFSGGWQMRIALAKLLLSQPDVILLDEPTNYLDMEARDWLQSFLSAFSGGIVIVAHDRDFLDNTVNQVAELYLGSLTIYHCNYTQYEHRRSIELSELYAAYEQQQAEIARLEDFIRRFRYNASKAAMVQSRIKQLEKMERIIVPESMKKVRFSFPAAAHSGKEVLSLRSVTKRYGQRTVLHNVDLMVHRGEKIAITGHNGAGKTTLLRICGGFDPGYTGECAFGTGVQVGYYSQDVTARLDNEQTVLQAAEHDCPSGLMPNIRGLLGAFLFRGDDVFKPVRVLSGGEKSRLAILRLLLQPYNLLVLDEPTNHLDIPSQDVLLDALQRYEGSVIVVSHDRDFLRELVGRVISITGYADRPSEIREYPGDYRYYEWKTQHEAVDSPPSSADDLRESQLDTRGYSREYQKEQKKAARKLRKMADEALVRIENIETERNQIELELCKPEHHTNGDVMKRLTAEHERLNALHGEALAAWEALEQEIDAVLLEE
ncbi:MAG: ABC-F family ATP-binding cassette domain-containing protein [Spirochaetota bacterium]